jgi:hypothetical protein
MTGTVNNQVTVAGLTFNAQRSVESDGAVILSPTLPAAVSGTLSTRTDNTTGTLTLASGHGVTTGARLDVYFGNGLRRYGVTVGTVSGTSVPISGGTGDNLPVLNAAVTAMVPVLENFPVAGGDLKGLFFGCDAPAVAVIRKSGPATVVALTATGSTGSYQWDAGSGVTNPFGTDVSVDVYLSHGGTASRQLRLVGQRD